MRRRVAYMVSRPPAGVRAPVANPGPTTLGVTPRTNNRWIVEIDGTGRAVREHFVLDVTGATGSVGALRRDLGGRSAPPCAGARAPAVLTSPHARLVS